MTPGPRGWIVLAMVAAVIVLLIHRAPARDRGKWGDDAISQWFRDLRQPDNPEMSCCGEADAYWADTFETKDDQYIAIITDTREDAPLQRPHVQPGTRVHIPNGKIKWDKGNPTGHGIVFIGGGGVYCFLPPFSG